MIIHVINGPNLNMLGQRNPEQYGSQTLVEIGGALADHFHEHEFHFYQSNHEGELIDHLQALVSDSLAEALIFNMGGLSHSSVAIRDAIEMIEIPKIEVHLSNIHAREDFRHKSVTASAADGVIAGFGAMSYHLAVLAIERITGKGRG
jgi:3-dehydroquinate dehydratase-2